MAEALKIFPHFGHHVGSGPGDHLLVIHPYHPLAPLPIPGMVVVQPMATVTGVRGGGNCNLLSGTGSQTQDLLATHL